MAAKKTPEKSFEEMLERLELLVRQLEKGEASLDESLKLYEEGTELIRLCSDRLNKAEQVVVRLQKGPDGAPQELPFDTEAEA